MKRKTSLVIRLYQILFDHYGPQGWWPLIVHDQQRGDLKRKAGYHPGDYSYPQNELQRFEIAVGAILTQNNSWSNVVIALKKMEEKNLLEPSSILQAEPKLLAEAIQSARYFNQKTIYLKNLARFWCAQSQSELLGMDRHSLRSILLAVKGIGEETADSVALYALGKPNFVVDAYTRRILSYLGWVGEKESYSKIKTMFETHLEPDLVLYQEYHALIVRHAKDYYQKRPYGEMDRLLKNLQGTNL